MTSPPATIVQTAAGSKVEGREPGGSATSSGQAPRSRTRPPPNRVTPSTREGTHPGRDVVGPQDPERGRRRRELGANIGRRQRPDVGAGADAEVGGERGEVVGSSRARGAGSCPLPASAAASADRVIDRSVDQNPVTGTSGTGTDVASRRHRDDRGRAARHQDGGQDPGDDADRMAR